MLKKRRCKGRRLKGGRLMRVYATLWCVLDRDALNRDCAHRTLRSIVFRFPSLANKESSSPVETSCTRRCRDDSGFCQAHSN